MAKPQKDDNRYRAIIEAIFFAKYRKGLVEIDSAGPRI